MGVCLRTTMILYLLALIFGLAYAEKNETEVKNGMKIVDADHFNDSVVVQNGSLPAGSDSASVADPAAATSPAASTSSTSTSTTVSPVGANLTTVTTEVTTTIPITTTTAPSTTTTPRPKKKRVPNKRRVCSCDLHLNQCDMNCCCDLDCKPEEKQLFSDCYLSDFYDPKVVSHNTHSCFRSNIFYRENSPYYIQETNNGMFCVVTENVEHSDQLESEPKNIDVKFLTEKKPKFSWNFIKTIQHPDINWERYKYGSVLLKTTGPLDFPNVSPFGIPVTLYGKRCSALENIKFLQPITSSCKHSVESINTTCTKNPLLNVNTFIVKNINFISNPGTVNLSESLVPVITASCATKPGSKYCERSVFSEPTWDAGSSVCKNIVESLELNFIHAGIRGISRVIAKARFGSYGLNSPSIRQTFSVNFLWRNPPGRVEMDEEANSTKTEETQIQKELEEEIDINASDYPRSGNPGYIRGKPVPMGSLVETAVIKKQNQSKAEGREDSNEQGENAEAEKEGVQKQHTKLSIALDKDLSKWMTIHDSGLCNHADMGRRNVLFGLGHQSECTLKVTDFTTCGNLQSKITDVILGEASSNFSDKYVPAYGNPDLDDLNEWVPVFISSLPSLGKEGSVNTEHGCDGIVASLKIKIAFAFVGPVNYPQAKIIGVLYEFGDSFNIPRKLHCNQDKDCLAYNHKVTVSTTVVFLDATQSPTLRIGQWPVVSIKLPQDFFYPFSTTSIGTSTCSRVSVLFVVDLVLIVALQKIA